MLIRSVLIKFNSIPLIHDSYNIISIFDKSIWYWWKKLYVKLEEKNSRQKCGT